MKCLWIGGWGYSPQHVLAAVERRFPQAEHHVRPPAPGLRAEADRYDWVGGHSLGAFLLLRHPERFPAKQGLLLLAPFLAFPAEAACGGRIKLAQLKLTARLLKKDPLAALNDFYSRADLALRADVPPYPVESLAWGLDLLARETVSADNLPASVRAVVLGLRDPLLDARRIARNFPGSVLLPSVGHRIEELLDGPDPSLFASHA